MQLNFKMQESYQQRKPEVKHRWDGQTSNWKPENIHVKSKQMLLARNSDWWPPSKILVQVKEL